MAKVRCRRLDKVRNIKEKQRELGYGFRIEVDEQSRMPKSVLMQESDIPIPGTSFYQSGVDHRFLATNH